MTCNACPHLRAIDTAIVAALLQMGAKRTQAERRTAEGACRLVAFMARTAGREEAA